MLELSEPINVWVFFKQPARNATLHLHNVAGGNLIQPYVFFWKGRRIKVEAINLVHTTKNGDSTVYHFSVSSGGNFYKLAFDLNTLRWFLEAVEEEI